MVKFKKNRRKYKPVKTNVSAHKRTVYKLKAKPKKKKK